MRLSDIASQLQRRCNGDDVTIQSISIDTRTLKPGALFVAIVGENFDGHRFLEQAKQQGAVAVIASQAIACDLPSILVDDTRIALGKMAAFHRQQCSIPFLAHTGSNGKTTTKEMLASILRQRGKVLATKGNLNNDIGVPLTLFELNDTHDYAVIELGANHPGEIAYTSQLVKPDVAMITNVAAAHTEGFGSIAGVATAKAEIFTALPDTGHAIINLDDAFASDWLQQNKNHTTITFAIQHPADFTAQELYLDENGRAQFHLHSPLGNCPIHLPLPGKHNVTNALAAAASASAVGATLDEIKAGLETVAPIAGRLNVQLTPAGIRIIDDSYNANPASMRAAIDFLSQLDGTKIAVLGDMGELGDNAHDYHREIGDYARDAGIHQLFSYGQLSHLTSAAFGDNAQHHTSHEKLFQALKPQLTPGVNCLIKGSRTAKMERIVAECQRVADNS